MTLVPWRGASASRWRALPSSTSSVVVAAVVLIAGIALVDSRVNLSFGLLYLFPIILVGSVLPRWQVVVTALLCTWLTRIFNPFPLPTVASLPQDILVFTALAGTGLVACEMARSRRREIEHSRAVEREAAARREAEEQLNFLITTSPAAIFTMNAGGDILQANAAAHRLLGVADGALVRRDIADYIPALAHVPAAADAAQAFQTEMQCTGAREGGAAFPAAVYFSTYNTGQGPRLSAMVVDNSAELLEQEESNFERFMAGSRAVVSALTHEVRNLCGAVAVVHENLVRSGKLRADKDFEALGTLVATLTRIASVQLKQSSARPRVAPTELREVLNDVRVVLDLYCEDAGISISWDLGIPAGPLRVVVDRHHLLQALLNLTKNSQRALQDVPVKRIAISVAARQDVVSIRVSDSGQGKGTVDNLFQPFQPGARSTGLGLYLSRALLRSFRGDLRYDPNPVCSFVIDLPTAPARERTAIHETSHDTHSAVAR